MYSSTANTRARLDAEELHQLRWLLGLVLALLAYWTLFGLDIGPAGLALVSFISATTFLCLLFPRLPGHIPAWVWRFAGPGLVVFVIGDLLLSRGDILPALVRIVALLAFYRALQYRRRREDMQLALLALFITVLSGVLTLSLLFGLQILLFAVAAMAQLFVVNLLAPQSQRALTLADWRKFRWTHFLGRLAATADLRLIFLWGLLFAAMVAVSTVLFVIMPRFRFNQSIAFPRLKAESGFSTSINYKTTSVVLDDSVAFRVDAPPGAGFSSPPYWRMMVLDQYRSGEDGGFHMFGTRLGNFRTLASHVPDVNNHVPDGPTSRGSWKIYMERGFSEYIPVLGAFDRILLSSAQPFHADDALQVYRLEQTPASVFAVQIDNMDMGGSILASREENNRLPHLKPAPIEERRANPYLLLELPKEPEDRAMLERMVAEIRGPDAGEQPLPPLEFARRAIQYLHAGHKTAGAHGLPVEGQERDLLFRWMDSGSPGWCEHFAGSFVFLARSAGLPARVVTGYKGANYNPIEQYYVVRQRLAHAWAEIYDAETRQWLRVDPTPGAEVPFAGAETGEQARGLFAETGWSARLDSLRMLWYRRVISFDNTDQKELAQNIGTYLKTFGAWIKAKFAAGWGAVTDWAEAPPTGAHTAQLLALLLAVLVLYRFRGPLQNIWLKLAARGWLARLQRAPPVRRRAGHWLARFLPAWRERAASFAPAERATWERVRLDLLALRYGPLDDPPDPMATFDSARSLLRS